MSFWKIKVDTKHSLNQIRSLALIIRQCGPHHTSPSTSCNNCASLAMNIDEALGMFMGNFKASSDTGLESLLLNRLMDCKDKISKGHQDNTTVSWKAVVANCTVSERTCFLL